MVGVACPRNPLSEVEDETEWPRVDVRNLIIDLDADIKADNMMAGREKVEGGPAPPPPRPHIPVGGVPTRPMTSMPQSLSRPTHNLNNGQVKPQMGSNFPSRPNSSNYGQDSNSADCDKSLKMKIKRTKSGRQEIVKTEGGQNNSHNGNSDNEGNVVKPGNRDSSVSPSAVRTTKPETNPLTPPVSHTEMNGAKTPSKVTFANLSNSSLQQLTSKRLKIDAGTSTDASTLTEPENLGPCEPGTAVNLEGIVWHETDTGVLVVNVTWRGKTYVGTLLDCTRHTNQWSAPRFTDSPEPGAKGRAKRGRSSAATPCEIEPRKNLRSSKQKGKGKNNKGKEDEFNFPAPSSPAKDSGKRKGRPESEGEDNKKRKRTGSESDDANSGEADTEEQPEETPPPPPPKREPKPVVYSYKMLECPRKDCNKQYKHDEGLKWHLSHSHPEYIDSNGEIKDAAQVEKEEQERKRKSRLNKEERRKEIKTEPVEVKSEKNAPPSKVAKLDEKPQVHNSNSPKPNQPPKPQVPMGVRPPIPMSANMNLTPNRPNPPQIRPPANARPIVPAQAPRQPGQLPPGLIAPNLKPIQPKPTIMGDPVNNVQLDDLKKRKSIDHSPVGSPHSNHHTINPHSVMPVNSPPESQEKPPANSPAYSDISDDGEDSRGKDLKLPTSQSVKSSLSMNSVSIPSQVPSTAPMQIIGSAVNSVSLPQTIMSTEQVRNLPPTPQLIRSSPIPRPDSAQRHERVSTPSNMPNRPSSRDSRPSPVYSSPSCGPSAGTPEYHKYLAANGFPPFPYPYPVGMDPNYHVQLLKTDPIYKSKWEKDRAEREKAFKEQLDRDQGKFSGLSLIKEEKLNNSLPSTPSRKPDNSMRQPEDLRKREPSGDHRARQSPHNMISVKAEFREKEEIKREVKIEEGVKPTMETRGPPPGPQTFGYMHPSLVRPPYSIASLAGLPPPFDPIFTSTLSPYGLPQMGSPNPYLSPAHLASIRPPGPFSFPGDHMRSPFPSLPSPEDMARAGLPGGPPGLSGTKALDLLQQHASQYYANQKLAELQERALKSPSNSMTTASFVPSPTPAKPITTLAGKESPTPTTSSDKSKSPPPLRHVHTHTHTHIGLGYPLLPPGALPPVPGALPPPGLSSVPGSLPPGALPPPPVGVVPPGVSGVPFSSSGSYPGKSP